MPTATSPARLPVAVLAAWRLSRLAGVDRISEPARERIAARADAGGRAALWLDELLACPWCRSVWSALAIVAVDGTRLGRRITDALAIASIVGALAAIGEERETAVSLDRTPAR